MKKIGMIALVTLAMSSTVLGSSFTDVPEGAWYNESVEYLTSEEMEVQVISGYTDGSFRPNEKLTVEQFLVLVNRALGNEFDTSSDNVSWSEPYMKYGITNNWLEEKDYSNQKEEISRELMAKILVNAVESVENIEYREKKEIISLIPDYTSVSEEYKEYVVKAYDSGLITGDEKGNFKPKETLTRAESAIIVRRILDQDFREPAKIDEEIVEEEDIEEDLIVEEIITEGILDQEGNLVDFTTDIVFDPENDVVYDGWIDGAMGWEKAEEYLMEALDNTKLYYDETTVKGYVEIAYPELPKGFEWDFRVNINFEEGYESVMTSPYREDDVRKIPNEGYVYTEFIDHEGDPYFKPIDTIKTVELLYWVDSTEHFDKHGRGVNECYLQMYYRNDIPDRDEVRITSSSHRFDTEYYDFKEVITWLQ